MPSESHQKIKIIQVIADSELGGGSRHVLGLLSHLDKKKFDCFLVCPQGYLAYKAKMISGLKVYILPFRSKFDPATFFLLRKLINKIRLSHNPFGPIIVHAHGPRAGLMTRLVRVIGVRYIYTEHLMTADYHLKNGLSDWLQKKTLAWQNKRTDAVIAVSGMVKNYLLLKKLSPAGRTIVIPNAINLSDHRDFSLKRREVFLLKQKKAPIIGTIGNLNPSKGHQFLITAFAQVLAHFPLAQLEIVGGGSQRGNLEKLIKRLGLERHVTLLGQREDTAKLAKRWSLFVLPSINESFGLALLEAFDAGLPVISTAVGVAPEIIGKDENGLLVKPSDSINLSEAIVKMLSDQKLVLKSISGGREAIKNYAWKRVIGQFESLYEKIV